MRLFALMLPGALTFATMSCASPLITAPEPPMTAPVNLVKYSDRFTSAGQPDAAYLQALANDNVDIVINIAPSTSHNSLPEEASLLSAAGITYLNIPVDWHNPTQTEFDLFAGFMRDNTEKKIFLHCQMNMRASAYAFLHRVINLQAPPETAMADMLDIWTPNPTWTAFINEALQRHEINFTLSSQQR